MAEQPPNDLILWESIPELAQQLIACELALIGKAHFHNLRESCHSWKAICNAEITSTCVQASDVLEAAHFLEQLPRLVQLTISGETSPDSRVDSTAQAIFVAGLQEVFLTWSLEEPDGEVESNDDEDGVQLENTMMVENLGNLLQPVHQSLTSLHLNSCHLSTITGNTLGSPGFFANFPHLVILQLVRIRCSPGLSTLNLAGCLSLRELVLRNCSLASLNVMQCTSLQVLSCEENMLSVLDVTSCIGLQDLNCSNNMLETLHLPPAAALQELRIVSNEALSVFGGGSVHHLACDSATFASLSLALRASLFEVEFEDRQVDVELSGFRNLRSLGCHMAEGAAGSIDFTQCLAVRFHCYGLTESVAILGRDKIRTLASLGGSSLSTFDGFTQLRELHFEVGNAQQLDLSGSSLLRKAHLQGSGNSSLLSSINLRGCTLLEEFCCTSNPLLAHLDLSSCSSLTELQCYRTGLINLDVSSCPLLTNLDVGQSSLLEKLNISNCTNLRHIRTSECPKLRHIRH